MERKRKGRCRRDGKRVITSGELKIEVLRRFSWPFVPLMNKWRVSLADGWKGVKIEGSHALVKKEQRKIAARWLIARGPLNPEAATRKGDAFRAYQGQGLLVADQFQKPD